jgi:hypothetical protein
MSFTAERTRMGFPSKFLGWEKTIMGLRRPRKSGGQTGGSETSVCDDLSTVTSIL